MTGVTSWWGAVRRSKVWRAWSRYGSVRGNVLAGGIAYFAFFSLLPALVVGFTVFGLVAGDRARLRADVVSYVNRAFGGATIIRPDGGSGGLVSIHDLVRDDVLSLAGLTSLILLLLTGLGWIGALRDGVSAVFQRREGPNPLLAKAGDLVVLIVFSLAALASMVASLLVTGLTDRVLDWLGLGRGIGTTVLVNMITSVVVLAIDTLLFLAFFRLLSGVELPWEDVFTGALAGGVAFGLLKLLGGLLLRSMTHNPLFAAFVVVAGLLIWMNLVARTGLLAAAWAATTAEDRGHLPPLQAPGPPPAPAPVDATAVVPGVVGVPTYSQRAADRTTLAAGAVLGITAAVSVRVLGRAGRTLRDAVRRADG